MASAPCGSVGCTSTGIAVASMACQTGSTSGSVRLRPAMLPSTITPTAPLPRVRSSSRIAASGYSQGSEVNQRIRSGQRDWAACIASLDSRAASALVASSPQ